jgi:hypothetical protein
MARGKTTTSKRTTRYSRSGKTKKSVSFSAKGKGKKPRESKHQEHRLKAGRRKRQLEAWTRDA